MYDQPRAPMAATPRRYVSVDVAAETFSVSSRTIRRMISRGEISGYRVGERLLRVDLNELDEVVRRVPSARGVA